MRFISDEQRERAVRLYKNKELTIPTISNLTDISVSELTEIFHEAFEQKRLKPRKELLALTPRTPNGQGKKKEHSGIGKGGRNKELKKFTDEQEKEIALDYYERGLTLTEVKNKWGVHPMQMQRIRTQYGTENKMDKRIRAVVQLDKNGQILGYFNNGRQAGLATGISYQAIYKCCTGYLKTAGGFVWKFKDDLKEKTNE